MRKVLLLLLIITLVGCTQAPSDEETPRKYDYIPAEKISKVLDEFKAVGIYDHLSEEVFQEKKQYLMDYGEAHPTSLLEEFPGTVFLFDPEGNMGQPYKDITLELAKISKGKFNPKNIKDNWSDKANTVENIFESDYSFQLGSETYEGKVKNIDDWIDVSFTAIINEGIEDQGIDGKFYYLYVGGNDASVVFATEAQAEKLREYMPLEDPKEQKETTEESVEKEKELIEEIITKTS